MEFFNFLWSPELQGALANLVLLFVGLFTTAVLANVALFLRSHTTGAQLAYLQAFAALAVKAAEQGALAGILKDKKASAVALVQSLLDSAKITGFTADDIEGAIEAAVLEFNQREGYALKMIQAEAQGNPFLTASQDTDL